ncbi:MAG: hypothetical protein ABI180_03145 [Microcoleus sp.]
MNGSYPVGNRPRGLEAGHGIVTSLLIWRKITDICRDTALPFPYSRKGDRAWE